MLKIFIYFKETKKMQSFLYTTLNIFLCRSFNSINELRGIFEQPESHRSSREENNNMLRLNHSNSQNTVNCVIIDSDMWTNEKEKSSPESSDNESINSDSKSR